MKLRLLGLLSMFAVSLVILAGCQEMDSLTLDYKEQVEGLPGTIQTYDEESNMIDQVKGQSISIAGNSSFSDSVLDITVGGRQMVHIGSTLIFYENGLVNVFDDFSKTVDIENLDRSTPIINRLVNQYESTFHGMSKVILIRSQSGKPLATFAGNQVSINSTSIDKMTKVTIDNKRMYIYRADYTIYDTSLLLEKDILN